MSRVLPEPPYRAELRRLAESAPVLRATLERLHGAVPIKNGPVPAPHVFEGFAMRPIQHIEGLEGAELAVLPAPPGQSITLLRCPLGAWAKAVSVPQQVRVLMVRGAFTWWQESIAEPFLLEAGQETTLAPNERHSYTALTDGTLNYNFFEPNF